MSDTATSDVLVGMYHKCVKRRHGLCAAARFEFHSESDLEAFIQDVKDNHSEYRNVVTHVDETKRTWTLSETHWEIDPEVWNALDVTQRAAYLKAQGVAVFSGVVTVTMTLIA
jgi:hypothetical protein